MDELGKGKYAHSIFLDIAEAFDWVDHTLLISKQQAVGSKQK